MSELPFHVDVSAQKAFYTSMNIIPPSDDDADNGNGNDNDNDNSNNDDDNDNDEESDEKSESSQTETETRSCAKEWKVSVGDTVAIYVDNGRASTRTNNVSNELFHHPYKVLWWCADIIAIYSNLDADEATDLKHRISNKSVSNSGSRSRSGSGSEVRKSNIKSFGNFLIEVRWLYKMIDIPGLATIEKKADRHRLSRTGLEELLETDDVDDLSAKSILGPVMIHAVQSPNQVLESTFLGMPLVHFFCHRLWSLHRKTLVPIGTSEKRMQRGMLYSRYLGRDTQTRAAFKASTLKNDTTGNKSLPNVDSDSSWRRRFQSTISILTLSEASDDSTVSEVIGREKQQTEITKFLASAVKGVNATQTKHTITSNNFCLFVGGPPGKFDWTD